MTKTLHNSVVHIKDEAMLHEAREILIDKSQLIDVYEFYISEDEAVNYLQLDTESKEWWLACKEFDQLEITLPELEQLLKKKQNEQNNS